MTRDKRLKDAPSDIHFNGKVIPRLMKIARPYWKRMAFALCMALIYAVMNLLRPVITGRAIDRYITIEPGLMTVEARVQGVLILCAIYVLVLIVTYVTDRIHFKMMQSTGQDVLYDMRVDLFRHVETLTMRFFDLTPVGKIVTRITNDVEAINDVFSRILVMLVENILRIIGLIVMMFTIEPTMALWALITLPVATVLTVTFRLKARKAYRVTKSRVTDINTFLSEHISGMKVIQLFAREERKNQEFSERSEALCQASFREVMINAVFRPLTYLLSVAALVIVLLSGADMVLKGALSIGTLYMFTQYVNSLFEPIQNLAEQFANLQSAVASAEKIFTLRDTLPLLKEPEHPVNLPEIRGRIEFDHVWFAYSEEEWVLKDVSFVIEPGQRVAFVGATGAGKSSILNLIGRYYDIQKGAIRIDGVDIRELDRAQLRAAIGQVQQDVFIFTGTIASNIRLRNEEITDEQVRTAAHTVNADRFIDWLPGGYAEPVSERGATFSAGQRQLLSFARTLAHDPKILILDEATANIDTETEQWIQEALERLMTGRTTILVAHRLSTIQHADRIIVMHHGRIREAGTHQELLAMDGIYKKLYTLQLA